MHALLAATPWGTLPNWLLLGIAIFAAWRLSRGGAGSAVSELSESNRVLERALQEERKSREALGGEVRDLRIENTALKEQTNFAAALGKAVQPLVDWTVDHEHRDQRRFESTLKVMDEIARRLGPDPNGDN